MRAVPLLLQTGLLSVVAGRPGLYCAPNEYARRSMQRMVATALEVGPTTLAPFAAALRSRNRAAFSAAVTLLYQQIPRTLFKRDSGGDVKPREAVYHAALFAALKATALPDVDVLIQSANIHGMADIIVTFSDASGATAWVIEIGLGIDAVNKLPQAQQYAQTLGVANVLCCAIVVNADSKPASLAAAGNATVSIAWSQLVGSVWTPA